MAAKRRPAWAQRFRLPAPAFYNQGVRRRAIYGCGILLLIVSASLVIWQGSFTFGEYAPTSPGQTTLYWAVSTLVFLLTVTLGFMLFRTGVKLYVERRSNREGSRLKTKLVLGALALTFLPVTFLLLWGVSVLNYNLAKWFSRPAEGVRINFAEVLETVRRDSLRLAQVQANWLALLPEEEAAKACRAHGVYGAAMIRSDGSIARLCGELVDPATAARAGAVLVAPDPRKDIAASAAAIDNYIKEYDRLALDRRRVRNFYLMLMAAITLFILFFATWVALFLSKQISNPITALLEAAGQVRKGDLKHRIRTPAMDELASLVRAFNEMTEALEASRSELERRRRFTEAILESIPTGVISVAGDGNRILRVNRALGRLLGDGPATSAARLSDLFPAEDLEEIGYMMKRARRTGVASRQFDLKTPRGTLSLAITVAAIEERVTSGFVMVLEDTTDLMRAQKLAAWQEVARRIAHEIKNPLTPIALSSERIARQVERIPLQPDTARVLRECTATIAAEVESVKTLVNAFSQFARFPAAQPVPADLNAAVEDALSVFAGRLDGIQIHRHFAAGLPLVNLDREQFRRAVVNLVDNAAEAMQDSPVKELYISTHATGMDTVELVIADTGRGLSPEEKERLFLPYFSTKGRGTGLGLAIVNQILTEHGATIRAEDNPPQGARFVIEIPALVADAEPKTAETHT
jgi:two-component system nitrogen regulation sensor histidine kinase NtrY